MGVREVNIRPTISFVGDSGSGGRPGAVPGPASGDAAANKFLHADGTFAIPAGVGDVTAAANIPDNAIVRGDGGAKGVQGDVELTFLDGLLSLLVTVSVVDNKGLLLKNDNSITAPDGWAVTPGAPGLFDGNLMISSDPSDFLNHVSVRFLPDAATAFVTGAAVGDNESFKSESAGALAFFMPLDMTGREETKISFVGFVGGTGHEGVFSIEGYAYGDSGLQFHRLAHFVIDADYRLHIDFLGVHLLIGAGSLEAGETGSARSLTTGLQLQGTGSVNDVTIYNEAHTSVIEIPTGTLNVNFAGAIRPAGTIEEDKGADIVSAATLTLGIDGNAFDVTGTTTITAVSAKPIGTRILLQFDAALTVTHNATTLILAQGTNFVTAAGNHLELFSYDGTNWSEVSRSVGDPSTIAEATGNITTTSTTDIVAVDMTITPIAGTYLVWFSTTAENDDDNSSTFINIYSGGSIVAASEREVNMDGTPFSSGMTATAKVTVNGSQAIEGRWRVSDSTGTLHERTLTILKVA